MCVLYHPRGLAIYICFHTANRSSIESQIENRQPVFLLYFQGATFHLVKFVTLIGYLLLKQKLQTYPASAWCEIEAPDTTL